MRFLAWGLLPLLLAELGDAIAKLRGSHLNAHLETKRLLTPEQVQRYVELRGY